MWRFFFAILAAMIFAPDGNADDVGEKSRLCGDIRADPDRRIEACTWLLQSGEMSGDEHTLLTNRGTAWNIKRDYDKALADHNQALALKSNDANILTNRGVSWSSKQEYDKAIADYEAALKIDPNFTPAREALTGVRQAKFMVQHGHKTKPCVDKSADPDKRIASCSFALSEEWLNAIDPRVRFEEFSYTARGDAWASKGDYAKAVADFGQALAIKPKFVDALVGRGTALSALGRDDEAIADLKAALWNNPINLDDVRYTLGRILASAGRYDEAIQEFTEINRLWDRELPQEFFDSLESGADRERTARVFNSRGVALFNSSAYDRAIADFTKAVQWWPRLAAAYRNRGLTWHKTGSADKYVKAAADFTAALEIEPGDVVSLVGRGESWDYQGKWEKAVADYTAALAIEPQNLKALRLRAQIWFDKKDVDKAIADYSAVLAIEPTNADALFQRGQARNMSGKIDLALADFSASLKIKPDNGEALYWRGTLWSHKKNYDKALEDFTAALNAKPNVFAALDAPDRSRMLAGRGFAWLRKGEYAKAVVDFDASHAERPRKGIFLGRGLARLGLDELANANADFDELFTRMAYDPQGLNYVAWDLATAENVAVRNGRLAVKFAQRALEISPQAYIADTLGAAHVYAGSFDKAVDAYERAISLGKRKQIVAYQKFLKKHGCYRGAIDGDYGPGTKSALKQCVDRGLQMGVEPLRPTQSPAATSPVVSKAEQKSQPKSAERSLPLDLEFWKSIKNSKDPDEFRAYLEAFPNGKFAPLAKVRIRKLDTAN